MQKGDGVWAVISDFRSETQLQRIAAESTETYHAFRMTKYMRKRTQRQKTFLQRAK